MRGAMVSLYGAHRAMTSAKSIPSAIAATTTMPTQVFTTRKAATTIPSSVALSMRTMQITLPNKIVWHFVK